jgi:hypothetical protein
MTASTVTVFNSRGTSFLPYETHLPAIKTHAQTPAWFSRADENKRRPRDAGAAAPTRAETPASKTRGKALPTPYASLMDFSAAETLLKSPLENFLAPLAQLAEQVILNSKRRICAVFRDVARRGFREKPNESRLHRVSRICTVLRQKIGRP